MPGKHKQKGNPASDIAQQIRFYLVEQFEIYLPARIAAIFTFNINRLFNFLEDTWEEIAAITGISAALD